ncbi:hypothetical protein CLOP_g9108 [Closterium sp. NIES-67]|nr:hypothetical protein CLOP_g9108 [Closterium sp. NIES-67]
MALSNSHPKNKTWVDSIHELMREVVIDWFDRHPRVYNAEMKGFKWGRHGLYIHHSGFEEEWKEKKGKGGGKKGWQGGDWGQGRRGGGLGMGKQSTWGRSDEGGCRVMLAVIIGGNGTTQA